MLSKKNMNKQKSPKFKSKSKKNLKDKILQEFLNNYIENLAKSNELFTNNR